MFWSLHNNPTIKNRQGPDIGSQYRSMIAYHTQEQEVLAKKLQVENLSRFEGAGVYYGATFVEAQLCGGDEVIVIGGGNSAGQAAVFLAQTAKRVHILVRSSGLAATMSRYLIRRIENSPTITLRPQIEIVVIYRIKRRYNNQILS